MKNMNLLMSMLQLLQTATFPPILAHSPLGSASSVDIRIDGNETGSWLLTCSGINGSGSWQLQIDEALEKPTVYMDGTRLWVALSFQNAVYLDDALAAQHPEQAGFWAAFQLKDGRLLGSGKVGGTEEVKVAGFVATSGNLDLVGVHGDRFFVLPLVTPFSNEYAETMVTTHSIGEPQQHTENPIPPNKQ